MRSTSYILFGLGYPLEEVVRVRVPNARLPTLGLHPCALLYDGTLSEWQSRKVLRAFGLKPQEYFALPPSTRYILQYHSQTASRCKKKC